MMDDIERAAIDSELGVRRDEAPSEDTRQKLLDLLESSHREYERSGMNWAALQAVHLAARLGEPAPEWTIAPVEAYRLQARRVIEGCAEEYFRTQNPMCAVQAYLDARSAGEPLPNWVFEYLDHGMWGFWRAFQTFNEGPAEERQLRNQPSEAFTEAFSYSWTVRRPRQRRPRKVNPRAVGASHGRISFGSAGQRSISRSPARNNPLKR